MSYPPGHTTSMFPYFWNDAECTSWLSILNCIDRNVDVDIELRDSRGNVTERSETLAPHQCVRFTEADFTGSVCLSSENPEGNIVAFQTMLEMRGNNEPGVALSQPARTLNPGAPPWMHHLDVLDQGPGQEPRTRIITMSGTIVPLNMRYCLGHVQCPLHGDWHPEKEMHVLLPPKGFIELYPFDVINRAYDQDVYTEGEGSAFAGAQFLEYGGGFSLLNHNDLDRFGAADPYYYHVYLVDVQDDGVNRADQVILKGIGVGRGTWKCPIHFYDKTGDEVDPGGHSIIIGKQIDFPDSYMVLKPREMLNKPFSGSIWIEKPAEIEYDYDFHLQAIICKQIGTARYPLFGKWMALCNASRTDAISTGAFAPNVIPYVSDKDPLWAYSLILFYSKTIFPARKKGEVLLEFYDMSGTHIATSTVMMNANETRYLSIHDLIQTWEREPPEPFEGSIEIFPKRVLAQLHLGRALHGHAYASNWGLGRSW